MVHKASAFILHLIARLGGGYVYGATGVICTISLLQAKEKQYGKKLGNGYYQRNGDYKAGKCSKWLGVWVADCSNLMQAMRRELGEKIGSMSAHMLWGTCSGNRSTINTEMLIPGMLVFRNDASATDPHMGHVGMFVGRRGGGGAWDVIESAGVTKGVIRGPLSKSWTHMGWPNWLEDDVSMNGPVIIPDPVEPVEPEVPDPREGEPMPVIFTTTREMYRLGDIGKEFDIPWTSIRNEDGSVPNPLNIHIGQRLIVGYKPYTAPVYFTTTKECHLLGEIGNMFGVDWKTITLPDGTKPNPYAIRIGMKLRVK